MSLIPALRRQRQVDSWVRGQTGLISEFQDTQGYTEKPPSQKKTHPTKKKKKPKPKNKKQKQKKTAFNTRPSASQSSQKTWSLPLRHAGQCHFYLGDDRRPMLQGSGNDTSSKDTSVLPPPQHPNEPLLLCWSPQFSRRHRNKH